MSHVPNKFNRRDFFTVGTSAIVGAAVLESSTAHAQLLGNPRILNLQEAVVQLPTLPFPVKIVWVCFAYNVPVNRDPGDMLIRVNTGEMPAQFQLPLAEALVDPRRRQPIQDDFFDPLVDVLDPNLPTPRPPFPQTPPPGAEVRRSRSILCIRDRRGAEVFVWYCFFAWHSDCVLIKIDNRCLCFHVDGD